MAKIVRTGVIGGGVMGRNHLRVLAALPQAELVGVVEPHAGSRSAVAAVVQTAHFDTVDDLLQAGVDAAVVAVPTIAHHAIAKRLMQAGVHVLVEKPIAKTIEEADDLIATAKATSRVLQVGHIERFNPAAMVLKNAIANEPIISISITRVGPFPPRIDDVGIVIDLGVHDIDLVSWLAGSPIAERQVALAQTRGGHEDTAFLQFRTANGTLAHINANWLTPYKERKIEVATTTRFLVCDLLLRTVTEFSDYRADGSYVSRTHSVPFAEPLRSELEAFLGAVTARTPPAIPGEDGRRALEIALACLADANRAKMAK